MPAFCIDLNLEGKDGMIRNIYIYDLNIFNLSLQGFSEFIFIFFLNLYRAFFMPSCEILIKLAISFSIFQFHILRWFVFFYSV